MTAELTATLSAMLLISAAVLAALSGVPMIVRGINRSFGQRCSTFLMVLASMVGLVGAILTLLNRSRIVFQLDWPFPFGPAECGVDPISAFFSLPILIVAGCCSIYALDYWPARDNPRTVRKLTFFFGLLVSFMLFVIMARSAGMFLLAW